jgi:hypothetical protein
MTASVTVGRALRYADGSARGLLHHQRGHGLLQHPRMSRWIKVAVREAMDEDPVSVLNDLEILRVIMLQRAAEGSDRDHR